MSKVVLDAAGITKALSEMADALSAKQQDAPLAVVGIRRGGESIARKLADIIGERTGVQPPLGAVDITLYRDDGFAPGDWPEVGVTEIPFEIEKHTVVLVDDVLYTGRTVRAAIDVIIDYGRPRAIRLAVLVDRGLREFPIGADATGCVLTTTAKQHVDVRFTEDEAENCVVVTEMNE